MLLSSLPRELLEHILSLCSMEDAVTVACCSRVHHQAVQHIVWKNVFLTYPECGDLSHKLQHFHNLRHTNQLVIFNPVPHENGARNMEDMRTLCNFFFNYKTFLESFEVQRVHRLSMCGIGIPPLVLQTLDAFKQLRTLLLRDVKITDWSSLLALSELKCLALSKCHLTDIAVEVITRVHRIEELMIGHCVNLTGNFLTSVSRLQNLRKLDLSSLCGSLNEPLFLDLKLLSPLTNLQSFSLTSIGIASNEPLNYLWRRLKKLKVLKLISLGITDVDLCEMSNLCSLRTLVVVDCAQLTSNCLVFVHMLKSLRSLQISLDMTIVHNVVDINSIRTKISLLDKMSSLNEIILRKKLTMQSTVALDEVLAVLCNEYKWGLNTTRSTVHSMNKYRDYTLFRCKKVSR